ncbi:MAG: hypothetical protein ACXWE9_00565 [Methylobacter sp.]
MMNIKSILIFLAVLVLSFNALAVESQEEPKIITPDNITLNPQNSPDTDSASHIVNSHTIPQASAEKPSEFMTALSVYLIIIVVYSLYGITADLKNTGN